MIRNLFDTTTLTVLKKGIEGTQAQVQAVSDNLANVSTPGYKRKTVRFEEALQRAIDSQRDGRRERSRRVEPELEIEDQTLLRMDGNTVDFDRELALASKTVGRNVVMTDLLTRHYAMIETALRERMR